MKIPVLTPYFNWLQKNNPVGTVEKYPELSPQGESSLKGLYIVGDLTGIPLLKMASEGGAKVVRRLLADPDFTARKQGPRNRSLGPDRVHDVVIVGGGPAGIACALECEKRDLDYVVLESSQLFSTVENFPKGKPILAKPDGYRAESPLEIKDGYKETLLEDLHRQLQGLSLETRLGARVQKIRRKRSGEGDILALETSVGEIQGRRAVLAIGKTGDARRLNIPGEHLPHVFNRLFDPADYAGEDILVVGGGDSAVEAAVALAEAGSRVTLSYRKPGLDRPKPENLERFQALAAQGKITALYESLPKEIRAGETLLEIKGRKTSVKADEVFVLIGREQPLEFFRRSGIRMAGEKTLDWHVFLVAMLSFFTMLYFGKAGVARDLFQGAHDPLGAVIAYVTGPFHLAQKLHWAVAHYAWYSSLAFLIGWAASLVFLVSGAVALARMARRPGKYFGTAWGRIKYGYLTAVALAFTWVYFRYELHRNAGWAEEPTYYYSLFYSLTIILFGIRRALVRKTKYIRYQVLSLAVFQFFFLFLLPYHLFDPLIKAHFAADSYVMREMFPGGKWSCFGFVLFWPLDMNDFGASAFWTWFPLVQTFGILFVIVKLWGKGAYCGWICSCGGMAETLGDEYREKAPHGKRAKRLDNIGQFVLAAALALSAAGLVAHRLDGASPWVDTFRGLYKLGIDVVFAGVLGFGLYFFLSGRVWCRFGCPLAALMHIYSRFSVYRIFAEKKKCISCNICTKVCHMGIDVMNYANKGVPMNDVQCVRCSACVQSCPTEVLGFGSLKKADTDNRDRREVPEYGKEDWRAGLRQG